MTARLNRPFLAFLLALCGFGSTFAQDSKSLRIRGIIAAIDGTTLSIAPQDGSAKVKVHLAPTAKIIAATEASFVDITPGTYVGITNTGPNGLQDALEIHVFPRTMRGAAEGQTPWDIGRHSRMTNGTAGAKVESYDGQNLTLTYKDGESTIQVRPNTPIVRLEPGTPADLKTGATVFIEKAIARAGGSLETSDIIVGRNGARPAM